MSLVSSFFKVLPFSPLKKTRYLPPPMKVEELGAKLLTIALTTTTLVF
jgi:hypothetical protein